MHGEIKKVVVTLVVIRLFLFCQVRQELGRTFVIQRLFLGLMKEKEREKYLVRETWLKGELTPHHIWWLPQEFPVGFFQRYHAIDETNYASHC